MRTIKRTITLDVEITYKITSDKYNDNENVYQILKIETPSLQEVCKEIVENEEGFND